MEILCPAIGGMKKLFSTNCIRPVKKLGNKSNCNTRN